MGFLMDMPNLSNVSGQLTYLWNGPVEFGLLVDF